MTSVVFCGLFDEVLHQQGPASVFLRDTQGRWRCQSAWTRAAWGWNAGPHEKGDTWSLARDNDTGFVLMLLVTSPTLLAEHPRMAIRQYNSREEALEALAEFGSPPYAHEPW